MSRAGVVSQEMRSLFSADPNRRNRPMDQATYVEGMTSAIRALAERGNVVLIGRGSQLILEDHPTALHVHLYAAPEVRARRIQRRRSMAEISTARAHHWPGGRAAPQLVPEILYQCRLEEQPALSLDVGHGPHPRSNGGSIDCTCGANSPARLRGAFMSKKQLRGQPPTAFQLTERDGGNGMQNCFSRTVVLCVLVWGIALLGACGQGEEEGPAPQPGPTSTITPLPAVVTFTPMPTETIPPLPDPTETALATPTPAVTATDPAPTAISAPTSDAKVTVLGEMNIRSGPSTEYEVIGDAVAGEGVCNYRKECRW